MVLYSKLMRFAWNVYQPFTHSREIDIWLTYTFTNLSNTIKFHLKLRVRRFFLYSVSGQPYVSYFPTHFNMARVNKTTRKKWNTNSNLNWGCVRVESEDIEEKEEEGISFFSWESQRLGLLLDYVTRNVWYCVQFIQNKCTIKMCSIYRKWVWCFFLL